MQFSQDHLLKKSYFSGGPDSPVENHLVVYVGFLFCSFPPYALFMLVPPCSFVNLEITTLFFPYSCQTSLSATSPPITMAATSLFFISVMLSLGEYYITEIIYYVIIKTALYHSA